MAVPLLSSVGDMYRLSMISGLVISVGGLSESVVKYSSESLLKLISTDASTTLPSVMANDMVTILTQHKGNSAQFNLVE
jgi:hypothetical protein